MSPAMAMSTRSTTRTMAVAGRTTQGWYPVVAWWNPEQT